MRTLARLVRIASTRTSSLILFGILLLAVSCGDSTSGPERRFDVTGTVVSLDREHNQVTLAHEEIPGYMAAMTMPFSVKETWAFEAMAPGDEVRATLVVASDRSWIEGISVSKANTSGAPGGGPTEPQLGSPAPSVELRNQHGKPISLEAYRGKSVLVTFIYTRCPIPDQCPLLTTNFAQVERLLKAAPEAYPKTHLLSVSIDPEYDTPEVLRTYGEGYGGGSQVFAHWDFATGSPEAVREFTSYFGLAYWPEKGQVIHSLRTALIGPDGKLVKLYRGNEWKPEEVVADMIATVR